MAATVTATTAGNSITIVSTETVYGVTTTTRVSRRKEQCYSNITGTSAAPIYSIIDHLGNTIFTKTFSGDTQNPAGTHSLDGAILFSTIWAAFNTWNGGVGAAKLLPEKVCIYQLSQVAAGGALSYVIVKNTLNGNIPLARFGAGVFTAAITAANFDKTKASFSTGGGTGGSNHVQLNMSTDTLTLTTSVSTSGTATDNIIPAVASGNIPIEIRVQH